MSTNAECLAVGCQGQYLRTIFWKLSYELSGFFPHGDCSLTVILTCVSEWIRVALMVATIVSKVVGFDSFMFLLPRDDDIAGFMSNIYVPIPLLCFVYIWRT